MSESEDTDGLPPGQEEPSLPVAEAPRFGPPDLGMAPTPPDTGAPTEYQSVFGSAQNGEHPPSQARGVVSAERQVMFPSIALIIANAIGAVFNLFVLMSQMVPQAIPTNGHSSYGSNFAIANDISSLTNTGAILGIITAILCIVALLRMQSLRSYELSLTAVIISMVPGLQPCCCIGTLVGVWPLIVLLRTDVREAFRAERVRTHGS